MSAFGIAFNPMGGQLIQVTSPTFSGGGSITIKITVKFELIEIGA